MGNLWSLLVSPPLSLLTTLGALVLVLAMRPRALQFVLRYSLFFFWILFSSLYGVLRGLLFRGDSQNLNHHSGRFFARITPFLGVTHTIEGEEHLNNRPCVYVLNHQSTLDLISVGNVLPPNTLIVAKKSLVMVPILGVYLVLAKNILVNRGNRESALKSMEDAGRTIRERKAGVLIFPEGTRSRSDGVLLPFKKGAFNLAVAGQVPIVPVVISNQKPYYDSKNWKFLDAKIHVKVLPPVPTTGKTREDVNELAEHVRELMGKELKKELKKAKESASEAPKKQQATK